MRYAALEHPRNLTSWRLSSTFAIMPTDPRFASAPADCYARHGFVIASVFDQNQVRLLERFAVKWVYGLFAEWTEGREHDLPLGAYHRWCEDIGVDHSATFRAANRHTVPPEDVERVILTARVRETLRILGLSRFEFWQEGPGWLAFRFVRPGRGDGYPYTRKEWGVAKTVVSCWIPIIGHDPPQTLGMVSGSHRRDYEKYLPEDDKFAKDEYRLAEPVGDLEVYRPTLDRGEAIFFHPKLLHSEDVLGGDVTRLSLEVRFSPLAGSPGKGAESLARRGSDDGA